MSHAAVNPSTLNPSTQGWSPARRPVDFLHSAIVFWLIAGSAGVVCFPQLRGFDAQFGWMPFWLIFAPLIDLIALHRRALPVLARRAIGLLKVRRSSPRQARSLRKRSASPGRPRARAQSVMPSRLRSMRRRNSSMMRR